MFAFCTLAFAAYATLSVRRGITESFGYGDWFFDHGWPNAYMCRCISENARLARWQVWSGIYRFRWDALLVNMGCAVVLAVLVTLLWWRHCQQCKPWQFRLKELLCAMTVLGIAFGSYMKLRSDYAKERAYLSDLEGRGWYIGTTTDYIPWYLQPLRDVGVVSDFDWAYLALDWGNASSGDKTNGSEGIDQMLANEASKGRQLRFVREVLIVSPRLSDDGVKSLCEWAPRCTSIRLVACPKVGDRSVTRLVSEFPGLRRLMLEGPTISDNAVARIGAFRALEYLGIDDPTRSTTIHGLKYVRSLPKLNTLNIPAHWRLSEGEKTYLSQRRIIVQSYPEPEDP